MKIQIPDQLKADMPQTLWGKILSATPIVMTVIATMLAGLSSSEMTRAQYARSLAAQQQSKSGDQWGFFQAKRLRGAMQRTALDMIENSVTVPVFDAAALRRVTAAGEGAADSAETAETKAALRGLLESGAGSAALSTLTKGELPESAASPKLDPAIVAVQEAIERSRPAEEVARLLNRLTVKTIEEAIREAKDMSAAVDAANKPVIDAVDDTEVLLTKLLAAQGRAEATAEAAGRTLAVKRGVAIARLRVAENRYDAEARVNQQIGGLYELLVRKSNLTAERHHFRSQRFFYGMLAAQMGVIVSTFAMAARKRNLLWSFAAAAGVAAVSFACYVYLFV